MKSILIILITLSSLTAQDYRYVAQIFPQVNKISNVVYGTAPFLNSPYSDERNTTTGNLVMDIYEPLNDDLNKRPVIIFVHSGGFSSGNRNHDDMVAFCNEYAKRGYVTVTIDYRKGVYFYADADLHYTRAVYRGIQDGRTAVRYLRANAALYGIDPSKIYMGGSSAGAFIGLHNIYMDKPEDKPYYAGECTYGMPTITAPDLGDYEIGNNLEQSGEANGIFSLWGAVGHTALITSDNDEPVFLVHGTADTSVPFDIGHPFGVATFPETHGSNRINMKLDSLSLTDKMTYFVEGEGHEFYGTSNGMWDNGTSGNAYWDSIMVISVDFFHRIHKPDADFSYADNGLTVDFTDLSIGALSWYWNFGDSSTGITQNPSHTYAEAGTYTVTLYIENDIRSFDTASYNVTVSAGALAAPEVILTYSGSPELSWQAVTNATSYKIYSSPDPYAEFSTWTLEATVTELTWTDLDAIETKKFYVVVAVK